MADRLYLGKTKVTPAIVKKEEVVPSYVPPKVIVNGVLKSPVAVTSYSIAPATDVDTYALAYAFYQNTNLTSADLSSLTAISSASGMYASFQYCTNLTSVDLSSLTTIMGNFAMYSCFNGCTNLTSVSFPALTTISGNWVMQGAFRGCTNLTSVDLSSLTTVSTSGTSAIMDSCFAECRKLPKISFPALTTITNAAFGDASYNYIFNGCTALTEIHFRADMQATIEAMKGYSSKWGATNATIYFDL